MHLGGVSAVLTETGECWLQEGKKKERKKERKEKRKKERRKFCCHCSEPRKGARTKDLHAPWWAWGERGVDRNWGVWAPGRKEKRKIERKKEVLLLRKGA